MSTQTFEGSSVEKALEEAAAALGVAVDELQYEVEEKASDFWGLGDTVFVVTVALPEAEAEAEAEAEEPTTAPEEPPAPTEPVAEIEAAEARDEPEAPPEPAEQPKQEAAAGHEEPAQEEAPPFFSQSDAAAPESSPEATDQTELASSQTSDSVDVSPTPVAEEAPVATGSDEAPAEPAPAEGTDLTTEAAGILDGIFAAMGFECTAEAKLDGDTMQVAITGEDNQYLLEGRGRGLAALELILNHSFRAWPNRAHKRVRVDAGDFRSQRDDEIRDMAYQVAHRAKETGSEQQTSDLNPYERRIVHLTLADDPQITTRSLGNGFLKAVNVIPAGERQRRDR